MASRRRGGCSSAPRWSSIAVTSFSTPGGRNSTQAHSPHIEWIARRLPRRTSRRRRFLRPDAHGMSHTIVTGVIGADTHIVGNRILSMALEDAGYRVVALGALTPAADFIKAA